jgi:hypothetical protein
MAVTTTPGRQWLLAGIADLGIANLGTGNGVEVYVPPGALATIAAHVVTAFDSTTATVSASDGTTTFISAEDAKAAALTNVTVDVPRKFFPNGGTITFTMAQTGDDQTVGRILGTVEYVIVNRSNEVQG